MCFVLLIFLELIEICLLFIAQQQQQSSTFYIFIFYHTATREKEHETVFDEMKISSEKPIEVVLKQTIVKLLTISRESGLSYNLVFVVTDFTTVLQTAYTKTKL